MTMICVLGPTASGKTRYAVKLAHQCGGEVISADSRQVYRGMDIGTGKDLAEYRYNGVDIPYHLIDIVEAGTKYNLFQYQQDFLTVYQDIISRGKQPILCGGTGMYIEAVTKGYSLLPVPPNPILRDRLEKLDLTELSSLLSSMKRLHNSTDIDSKKRVIRALEIEYYLQEHPTEYSPFIQIETSFIGLSISRERRRERIDIRLEERLSNGLIEEVQRLLNSGISPADLIYYGLEYKFVTLYLLGTLSYDEMVRQLKSAIHQFAKRQMTWFRGMERKGVDIEWIEV